MLRPESATAVPESNTVVFGATTCDALVIVTAGEELACNAACASSKPAPQSPALLGVMHHEPAGNGRADDCKMDLICPGVNIGLTDKRRAATPETCGAALLVPEPRK